MVDFPPISKEYNPEVLAAYVLSHYESTRDIIAYNSIPPITDSVPLKIAKKRKSMKDKSDVEEEAEVKPKKQKKDKKAPELIVSKPTLPGIQEEVANLGPIEVLEKRTRGGSSEATSQSKPKVQKKKANKKIMQMVVSRYTEEKDAELEASAYKQRQKT